MKFKPTLLIAFLLAVTFLAAPTRAMTLEQFERLNDDDEAGYIAFLVDAAAKMLKDSGHPDQADKAEALFRTPGKDGGVAMLAGHLKTVNAINNRNATNPNNRAHVFGIEDAMEMTFKDAGLVVPAKFLVESGKAFESSGIARKRMPSSFH